MKNSSYLQFPLRLPINYVTGKSFSEALILGSVNPQYDDRLFIHSWIQYKKNTSWEHVVYKHCFEDQNINKKQCLYTTCSEVVFFLYWSQESMNNLSLYCGLTDWRMSASDTDLPVLEYHKIASSNKSRQAFSHSMKGIFYPYVLWPFGKNLSS